MSISEVASLRSLAAVSISEIASFRSLATVTTSAIFVATVLMFEVLLATVVTFALMPATVVTFAEIPATVVTSLAIPETVVMLGIFVEMNDLFTASVSAVGAATFLIRLFVASHWKSAGSILILSAASSIAS